jgi:hypothetical protein
LIKENTMTENDKIEQKLPEEELQAINGGGGVISCFKGMIEQDRRMFNQVSWARNPEAMGQPMDAEAFRQFLQRAGVPTQRPTTIDRSLSAPSPASSSPPPSLYKFTTPR